MSRIRTTLATTLATTIGTAIGAATLGAAGTATAMLVATGGPASASQATTDQTSSIRAVADADGTGRDGDCGPRGGWGGGGGWGSGEAPGWVQDHLADLPAELRADLRAAFELTDRAERRDALKAVRDKALAGDYGAEAQERAEELGSRGPWGGHGPFGGGPFGGWSR